MWGAAGGARLRITCSSGRGFGGAQKEGSAPPKKGGKRSGGKTAGVDLRDAKAVDRAVELVEKKEGRQAQARPVDAAEARRGSVQFVRVADWGGGEPADLGQLQVAEEGEALAPGGKSSADGEAGAPSSFNALLAQQLQQLQSSGALALALDPGAPPLPPFERWAFQEEHYLQYLADLHAVHAALEGGIAAAEAALAGSGYTDLHQAAALFSSQQGLDRAQHMQHDLQVLQLAPEQAERAAGQAAQRAPAAGGVAPRPTQTATAYASYLGSLSRQCVGAESSGEAAEALLRLLAHAYMLRLAHLSSGGRIGAKAAERLQLAPRDALRAFRTYPELPSGTGNPLQVLIDSTDRLGQLLAEAQQDSLLRELAKAATRSSCLLTPLAREQ